eukprot:108123-Hanusia_phi.AAC.1
MFDLKSSRNRTIAAVFYLATDLTADEIKARHSLCSLPQSSKCISISDKVLSALTSLPHVDSTSRSTGRAACPRPGLATLLQVELGSRRHATDRHSQSSFVSLCTVPQDPSRSRRVGRSRADGWTGAHVRNGESMTELKHEGEDVSSLMNQDGVLRDVEGRGRSIQRGQIAGEESKSGGSRVEADGKGGLSLADVRSLSPRHLDAVKYNNLQYKYGFQDDSEIEKVFQEKKGKWQRNMYDDDDDDDDYGFLPRQSSMMSQEFHGNFSRSELVEALYWWLSVYQDPVVIERALVQLKLHSLVSQGEQLTTEQMVAVLEVRDSS